MKKKFDIQSMDYTNYLECIAHHVLVNKRKVTFDPDNANSMFNTKRFFFSLS